MCIRDRYFYEAWGALAGSVIAAWLWFVVDLLRALRVLRWLRRGDAPSAPAMHGMFGEITDLSLIHI